MRSSRLCPCERDLIFKPSPEKDNDEEEGEVGGGGRGGGRVVFTEEVGGQIIKRVRLLATSSNLKELINAASEARGSANQLASSCLAMLMPSGGSREGSGAKERSGVTIGRRGCAIADHFINLYKGWRRETDQFAISSTKTRT